MTIGNRIREERNRLGLSQEAMAELAGASKRSQIDWEKGVSTPNAAYLEAVAKAGADVLYIVTGISQRQRQAQVLAASPAAAARAALTLLGDRMVADQQPPQWPSAVMQPDLAALASALAECRVEDLALLRTLVLRLSRPPPTAD